MRLRSVASVPSRFPPERDVEVVTQPGRERDVPAMPEIGDARREVRHREVFRKDEAEEARAADGDVAVPREIEIDLHAERENGAPRREHPRMRRGRAEIRVCRRRELIGDRHLLYQTEPRTREPVGHVFRTRRTPREQLAEEETRAHDRPRKQLREERQVERVVERPANRGHASAIDVDEIRDALKGVEADADRHEEIDQPWILVHAQQRRHRSAREVRILERSEKREVCGNPQRQHHAASPPLQRDRDEEIACGEDPQEQHVPRVPTRVKIVARDQQHPPARSARQQVEQRRDDRDEQPELVRLELQRYADADGGGEPGEVVARLRGARYFGLRSRAQLGIAAQRCYVICKARVSRLRPVGG